MKLSSASDWIICTKECELIKSGHTFGLLAVTGITRPEYRKAVQDGSDIEWRCRGCFVYDVLPDFESTRIEDGKLCFLPMLCYFLLGFMLYVMICYVFLCYLVIPCRVMPCHVMSCLSCCVMLCHVILLCYVVILMLCYFMLSCFVVMLCYVIFTYAVL